MDDLVGVTSLNLPTTSKSQSSQYGCYLGGATQHPLPFSFVGGSLPPPPQPGSVSGTDFLPDSLGRKVSRQGDPCIPFPELSRVVMSIPVNASQDQELSQMQRSLEA